jgi:uncharacterized damage-inducible protein DinB
MDDIWRDALLYNKWANLQVIDACGKLTADQMELTVPSTYGTIAANLMHILGAEQRYLRRLTGAEPTLSEKVPFPGLDALREHAIRSGDGLVEAAAGLHPDETTQVDFDGEMVGMRKSLIVVQAIHHGNDHRTQIGMILGQHSLPVPEIDVWSYEYARHVASKC